MNTYFHFIIIFFPQRNKLEIEMEAFDPAQKIKVIKEVREIFKLGLKEVWGE